ncbi:MAG: tetratricopeptide repeat protein [Elusimicrobiota bacterium]
MGRFDWLETEVAKIQKASSEKERFDVNYYLQEAEKLFREGGYETALRSYSKALGEDPTAIPAWLGQVRCLLDLDELKEARVWVNKALEKFPESAELLSIKAVVLARMYEINEALVLSNRAISKKEPSKYIWLDRGFVLLSDNDETNAEHCFSKVLEGNPLEPFFNLRIGICYLDCKKFEKAKIYLEKCANISASNPLVWYKLGQCNEGLGFIDRALWCYEKSLALKPEFTKEVESVIQNLKGRGIFSKLKNRLKYFCVFLCGKVFELIIWMIGI